MTLFGFVQLDLAGAVAVADGRYVLRDGEQERVLVLDTIGAPPPPRRRRRRPREAEAAGGADTVPLTRATTVRAFAPFEAAAEGSIWLERAVAEDDSIDALVDEGLNALNRALHANTVASGDPGLQTLGIQAVVATRIGYGSGEEVADSAYTAAREVDPRTGASRRQQRAEDLAPQERVAAILGGREQLDACETLLLRARADLDAGRAREAALQLRVGFEALLVEMKDAMTDPGHSEDMATIESRRKEVGDLANAALLGNLNPSQLQTLGELLALCERVLRRRRVLGG